MRATILTAEQCRMGRAYLSWSQPELAERAGLSLGTVSRFECGEGQAGADTIAKLASVFELAGLEMLPNGGVSPKSRLVTILEGPDANYRVMEDVLHTLKAAGGGEVLIAGLAEAKESETERRTFVLEHIGKLQAAGITERILLEHGDRNLLAPQHWYRWMPQGRKLGAAFHLYGDKIAMKDLGPEPRIVVVEHAVFAATVRGLFDLSWMQAVEIPA